MVNLGRLEMGRNGKKLIGDFLGRIYHFVHAKRRAG
jgi:hypothetical protein